MPRWSLVFVVCAVGSACASSKQGPEAPVAAIEIPAAAAPTSSADDPPPKPRPEKTPRAVATAPGTTGNAACDEYLARMQDCMGKMPDAAREAMKQAGDALRDAVAHGTSPEAQAAISNACRQAKDSLVATCK